jgi:hypothetical protein
MKYYPRSFFIVFLRLTTSGSHQRLAPHVIDKNMPTVEEGRCRYAQPVEFDLGNRQAVCYDSCLMQSRGP